MNQEIAIIVDRSGSMHGKEMDTVGGINSSLDELRKNKNDAENINVSIKLFDHDEKMIMRHRKLDNSVKFNIADYCPRGSTSLYDAIGNSLVYFMEMKIRNPNAYDSCVMYIATDGLENTSKQYSSHKLKELIKNANEIYGIDILYLGSNQDAILEAGKIGINYNNAINYSETSDNIDAVYRSAAAVASRRRSNNGNGFLESERQASMTPSEY